ncbi:NUDIX hydrolase [Kushneria aurantia]|uniref:NUDIX hydrolase n=1 Tax=Kushneria aurantia TaxID=504092 RepID=A0ABV6FZ05_9GAMM|nr:NUDIX hydrolase [Kushneria aurantia]
MNFCSHCGAPVRFAIPMDDDRPRYLCDNCGTIHYQNPRIVAGSLPIMADRVLLCRRAITPREGYWTLPAGFMENGETTREAAIRETREEACAEIEVGGLYTLVDLPHINQVYMIYLARLAPQREPAFAAGPESLEVRLFSEAEIPWASLAFSTVTLTLEHFFADRRHDGLAGDRALADYPLHDGVIRRW